MSKQRNQGEFSAATLERKFKGLSGGLSGRWEKPRFERALSWLKRSENEGIRGDHDVRFILLWVALDSLFGREADILPRAVARARIPSSVANLLREDKGEVIWRECYRQRETIARILKNPYICNPFWRAIAENGIHSRDALGWSRSPEAERELAESIGRFVEENDEVVSRLRENTNFARRKVVRIVFGRLGTLRNQLMHGASAHQEGLNRSQVEDGHHLLSALVPRILHLMMESPDKRRGVVAYPPFGEKNALFDRKFDEEAFDRFFKRTMGR